MAVLTVSVPEDVKNYVERQVGEDFADAGEVVAALVRQDRERRLEEVRKIVDEARAGGVSERTVAERIAEGDRILRTRKSVRG